MADSIDSRECPENEKSKINPFDRSTWSEEEIFYFSYVDRTLRKLGNVSINNGKPIHAVYLIAKLLEHARKRVRLFSGRLTRIDQATGVKIYADPNVAEAAKCFLKKSGSRFTVILESDIDVDEGRSHEDHPLVKSLVQDTEGLAGKFELHKASSRALEFLSKNGCLNHLMIMDEQAYRVETRRDDLKAEVNFGDSRSAKILADLFDNYILPDSEEIPTPGRGGSLGEN